MPSADPPLPPTGLPIEGSVGDVRAALASAGLAVLTAEPGAGKTTVVPLRLLDEPWLRGLRIVVLEPRRVAARAAARRMAALTGTRLGDLVGYRTRDERVVTPSTRIEVVTEGILTRRLQGDPGLEGVGLVVFDEFHERNLHADVGLALALDARAVLRPDLALLVMSATLDAERVAAHLGGAPSVRSEGRQHPVDIRWAPRRKGEDLDTAVTLATLRALRDDDGDVLVFLPGAGEISRVVERLRSEPSAGACEIWPLHGGLSSDEQDAALAPSPDGRRKVVVATDIAETSLTVEGVRLVVDSGLSRAPRFDPRTGMTRLTTVAASKASCEQRAGRAGRVGPGAAYRLWSKVEHAARRPHRDPEITQVDLASLALDVAAWGAPDAAALPFLDPPPRRAYEEGVGLLRDLGALDGDGRITPLGRRMAELPLHPRLAHMVLVARESGDGWLACLVAAVLAERDVLRGRSDDLPADLVVRLDAVEGRRRHPAADAHLARRVLSNARDVARRAGVSEGSSDTDRAGRVLALAYPDRLAQNRFSTTAGRFKLRNGAGAWLRPTDALAAEPFVVAADLDGGRRDARIRVCAPIDASDVLDLFGNDVSEHESVLWDRDRDDAVARVERTLGQLKLGVVERPAPAGPVTERLLRRVLRERVELLSWDDSSRQLRARLAFLHARRPADWPSVSDSAIASAVDLDGITARWQLGMLDAGSALHAVVGHGRDREIDRLVPSALTLASGRRVAVDYSSDPPVVASRVQDFFGQTTTPTVLDGEARVVAHLLSPAGRPVQITSDLESFWTGSWREVRKEMAGRYPKHSWPEHPSA